MDGSLSPVQPASVSSSLGDTRGPATRACKNHGNLLCFLFFTISSVSVFLHLCMTAARRDLQLSLVDFLATSPFVSYGIRGRLFARATFRVRCNIDLHSVMNVMLAAGPELMAFSSTCSPAAAYSASQLVESCLVCSATPAESLSLSFMHTRLIFETDGPKTAAPPFFFFYPKFHSPIVITALFLPQFGIVFSSRNNQLENDDGQGKKNESKFCCYTFGEITRPLDLPLSFTNVFRFVSAGSDVGSSSWKENVRG